MAEVPVQPQQTSKGINWKTILISAVIGGLVVGAGVLGFYLVQGQSKDTTSTQVTTPKTAADSAKQATPSAEKDETADWKIYKNSKLGFSIKYPSKWNYNDAAKYASDNCGPGPNIGKETVIFDRDNLECVGIAHGSLGAEEFVVVVADTEYEPLEQLTTQEYEYIEIDGEKAAKTYKTPTSEGPWCSCTRITFNHNESGYMVEFVNEDLKGNHDAIYDQMLSTFKFLD